MACSLAFGPPVGSQCVGEGLLELDVHLHDMGPSGRSILGPIFFGLDCQCTLSLLGSFLLARRTLSSRKPFKEGLEWRCGLVGNYIISGGFFKKVFKKDLE